MLPNHSASGLSKNNYSLNRQHLVIFLEAHEMAGPEFTEYDLCLIY